MNELEHWRFEYYVDIKVRLAKQSPNLHTCSRAKIGALIGQVRSIIMYSHLGGVVTLSAAEYTLGDTITSRLYRERCREDEPTDTLAIRSADAFIAQFLSKLEVL